MVRVTIERETCVSCGSCYETCPDFFEENPDDSFSQIRKEFRKGESISEGDAPPDQEMRPGCGRSLSRLNNPRRGMIDSFS